ncbi:MAG: DUF3575 domain-containing protein [Bacteroidales bacterium]|nr:DUF3575 domain-containing protein [Bacteroidales bacterium]
MTKLNTLKLVLSASVLVAAMLQAGASDRKPAGGNDNAKTDTLARRAAGVSIRTNLAWDAFAQPNLGVEFPVGDHWSLGANAGIKTWPRWLFWDNENVENTTHWRNFAVVPEVRYYLKEVYNGFFAGADFVYTHFNVGNVKTPFHMYPEVEEYRDQGSFWGGGLFVGYAWWPWQHWRLEVEAGAAVGLAAYERFDCANCGSKLADESKPAVVPKIGLNIAYNTVARDKRPVKYTNVISGTDTLTVLTPPVAFVVHLTDVAAPETTGDKLAKEDPWVIPIHNYRPLDYLTRPGRDSILTVNFPVDSWELDKTRGTNGQVLDALTDAISSIKADERTSEMLVSIVGLASIEGPQDRNDTLSVRRAKVVADYLSQSTGLSRRNFETIGKGEAWDWFKAQLNASEGSEKLKEIMAGEQDPDKRERLIKANDALYNYVRDNFLADQRNSGYIRVYYNNAPDPVTEDYNNKVLPLLKAKRYHDAVRALNANPAMKERALQDAEAANAYGIALYFTALDSKDGEAEKEAIELIKTAAKNGSVEAKQNLEGIEIYGPARKEYEAWVEAMKEK